VDHKEVLALIIAPPGRMRDSWHVLLRATHIPTTVAHADDGAQGLHIMARHPSAWVLLDSSLEEDAWQTLEQLKREWSQARCLVVVYRAAQEQKAKALGAHGIIPGNCSLEQLKVALRKLQVNHSSSLG
jgi:DNA-binding NarL/FixJ family response regulator